MPQTNADLHRLLDDAKDAAPQGGLTLRESLRNAEKSVGELVANGSIANVSKNASSHSYAFSGAGSLTTAEVARAWRQLITLHDDCLASFVAAGTSEPTDAELHAEMMARLRPVYRTRLDLTLLRSSCIA